jgi:hypothetical protein
MAALGYTLFAAAPGSFLQHQQCSYFGQYFLIAEQLALQLVVLALQLSKGADRLA